MNQAGQTKTSLVPFDENSGDTAVQTMSSREIAELTSKEHKNVLADIRNMLESLGLHSADFSAQYKDPTGRFLPEFKLPKRETSILVSGYSVELRARIIDRWRDLEAGQTLQLPDFGNPAIAARAWADQFERRLKAEDANRQIAAVNAALAPKADFYDAVASAVNCQTVDQVAKLLGFGPRTFFGMLKANSILRKDTLPIQEYLDRGYFIVVEKVRVDPHGENLTYTQTLITGKGVAWLQKRYRRQGHTHYDDFEVTRVVEVELDPKAKQSDLVAALEPVVSRLLGSYKEALARWRAAQATKDTKAAQEAKDEMDSLILFKRDMGTFQRVYTFLSQIFDYGNTAIEGRNIFYRRLLPLLDFGREREEIDLSKVQLTHHTLKNKGKQAMLLGEGDTPKLPPITDIGSGSVQEKEKALLAEIIAKVNDLFEGELTEDDKLVYVNNVIKGKLLESEVLVQQASNNTKEQFSNSPDLANGILYAIMDALTAHSTMSKQALESEKVRSGLKDVLLGPARLYEALRARGEVALVGDNE
jgi:phage antirepressor YoqD-like protein